MNMRDADPITRAVYFVIEAARFLTLLGVFCAWSWAYDFASRLKRRAPISNDD